MCTNEGMMFILNVCLSIYQCTKRNCTLSMQCTVYCDVYSLKTTKPGISAPIHGHNALKVSDNTDLLKIQNLVYHPSPFIKTLLFHP